MVTLGVKAKIEDGRRSWGSTAKRPEHKAFDSSVGRESAPCAAQ
jgi:hypothetical protein